MRCRDDHAAFERNAFRVKQMRTRRSELAEQKLRLLMGLRNNGHGVVSRIFERGNQTYNFFHFFSVVLKSLHEGRRAVSLHRDQMGIWKDPLRKCSDLPRRAITAEEFDDVCVWKHLMNSFGGRTT